MMYDLTNILKLHLDRSTTDQVWFYCI